MGKTRYHIITVIITLLIAVYIGINTETPKQQIFTAGPTGLQIFEPAALGITGIDPSNFSQAATREVNITGTDFNSSATINFTNGNITVLSYIIVNSTLIQANITVSINTTPGTYNVTIEQINETSTLADGLTVYEGPFNPATLIALNGTYFYVNSTVNLTYNITTAPGVNKTQVNITGGWMNLTNINTSNWTWVNLSSAIDPEGTFTIIFDEITLIEEGDYSPELYLDLIVDGEYKEREYYAPYFGVGAVDSCDVAPVIAVSCCLVGDTSECPLGFVCGADGSCEPLEPSGTPATLSCPLAFINCQVTNAGTGDDLEVCEPDMAPAGIFSPQALCLADCSQLTSGCAPVTVTCGMGETSAADASGTKICVSCGDGVVNSGEECDPGTTSTCPGGAPCLSTCECESITTTSNGGGGGHTTANWNSCCCIDKNGQKQEAVIPQNCGTWYRYQCGTGYTRCEEGTPQVQTPATVIQPSGPTRLTPAFSITEQQLTEEAKTFDTDVTISLFAAQTNPTLYLGWQDLVESLEQTIERIKAIITAQLAASLNSELQEMAKAIIPLNQYEERIERRLGEIEYDEIEPFEELNEDEPSFKLPEKIVEKAIKETINEIQETTENCKWQYVDETAKAQLLNEINKARTEKEKKTATDRYDAFVRRVTCKCQYGLPGAYTPLTTTGIAEEKDGKLETPTQACERICSTNEAAQKYGGGRAICK